MSRRMLSISSVAVTVAARPRKIKSEMMWASSSGALPLKRPSRSMTSTIASTDSAVRAQSGRAQRSSCTATTAPAVASFRRFVHNKLTQTLVNGMGLTELRTQVFPPWTPLWSTPECRARQTPAQDRIHGSMMLELTYTAAREPSFPHNGLAGNRIVRASTSARSTPTTSRDDHHIGRRHCDTAAAPHRRRRNPSRRSTAVLYFAPPRIVQSALLGKLENQTVSRWVAAVTLEGASHVYCRHCGRCPHARREGKAWWRLPRVGARTDDRPSAR